MPAKKLRVGRFTRKKQEDGIYFLQAKVTGAMSGKMLKVLKDRLNQVVFEVMNPEETAK